MRLVSLRATVDHAPLRVGGGQAYRSQTNVNASKAAATWLAERQEYRPPDFAKPPP